MHRLTQTSVKQVHWYSDRIIPGWGEVHHSVRHMTAQSRLLQEHTGVRFSVFCRLLAVFYLRGCGSKINTEIINQSPTDYESGVNFSCWKELYPIRGRRVNHISDTSTGRRTDVMPVPDCRWQKSDTGVDIRASCLFESLRHHLNDSITVLTHKCYFYSVSALSSHSITKITPTNYRAQNAPWHFPALCRMSVVSQELVSSVAEQLVLKWGPVSTRAELTSCPDLSVCGRRTVSHHNQSASRLHICSRRLEATTSMCDTMTAVNHTNRGRSWRWKVVRGGVVLEMCLSTALETLSRRSPPPDVCWYRFRLFCSVSRHLGWPLIDTGLLSVSSAGWCDSWSQPPNWSKRPCAAQEIGQQRWLWELWNINLARGQKTGYMLEHQ